MSSSPKHIGPMYTKTGLDMRIDRALEHKPELYVPPDFAARVAARVAAQPAPRRRRTAHFGKRITLLSAGVIMVALFALAPHASLSVKSLSFDAELVLLAELALIGGWIARLPADPSKPR